MQDYTESHVNGNVKVKLNRYFLCIFIMQTSLSTNRTKEELKPGYIRSQSGTDETEKFGLNVDV